MTMPLILRFPATPATCRAPLNPLDAASARWSAALGCSGARGGTPAKPAEQAIILLALAAPLPLTCQA
jgi:hypothetical protein